MRILALDIATKTGWAMGDNDVPAAGGILVTAKGKMSAENDARRYHEFATFLSTFLCVDAIAWEQVRRHVGTQAAHVYGGLLAIAKAHAYKCMLAMLPVGVGEIKKFATGKGNAKKEDVIDAMSKRYPSIEIVDDNHADALALYAYARENLVDEIRRQRAALEVRV